MFVFDPQNLPNLTSHRIRKLFSLSEAEAELAVALCAGKSLDEIAQERSLSLNTEKSQLKSAFVKTGTGRQAELVSLLLASPACILAPDAP